jgi:hypothetical protein
VKRKEENDKENPFILLIVQIDHCGSKIPFSFATIISDISDSHKISKEVYILAKMP